MTIQFSTPQPGDRLRVVYVEPGVRDYIDDLEGINPATRSGIFAVGFFAAGLFGLWLIGRSAEKKLKGR